MALSPMRKPQKCPECDQENLLFDDENGVLYFECQCCFFRSPYEIKPMVNKETSCPECQKGILTKRLNRNKGLPFWGCSNYPNCTFTQEDW